MTDPADDPSPRPDSSIDGGLRLEGLDDGVEHLFATRPTTTGGTASPFGDAREATRRLWSGDTGPLIATGHQATFRHPGILAKDFVANGLADALGGRTLRLLVDQDVHPIGPLQIPLRASSGELRAVGVACREPHLDAPTGRRPPMELDPEGPPAGLSREIAAGVDAIGEALRRESEAPSAALQVAAAMDALVEGVAPLPPSQPATELLSTPIGLATLAAIAEAPRACAATFNEALALDPRAARPLRIEPERVEVPLWWIGSNRPRERVHLDPREPATQRLDRLRDAAVALPSGLAPRGLLMTGLVRSAADLFIHGRGGWRYDRVTDRWFASWLGVALAPMAMVSADLRLPLGDIGPTREETRRRWHDPENAGGRDAIGAGGAGELGGTIGWNRSSGPSPSKAHDLRAIAAAPRGSAARREAFLAMHRRLALQRRDRDLDPPPARGSDPVAIAGRRDWAYPLHAARTISSLAEACERAVRDSVRRTRRPAADTGGFSPAADPAGRSGSRATRSGR